MVSFVGCLHYAFRYVFSPVIRKVFKAPGAITRSQLVHLGISISGIIVVCSWFLFRVVTSIMGVSGSLDVDIRATCKPWCMIGVQWAR